MLGQAGTADPGHYPPPLEGKGHLVDVGTGTVNRDILFLVGLFVLEAKPTHLPFGNWVKICLHLYSLQEMLWA